MKDVLYIRVIQPNTDLPTLNFQRNTSANVIQKGFARKKTNEKNKEKAIHKIQRQVRIFLMTRPFPKFHNKEEYMAEIFRRFYLLKMLFPSF